MALTPAGLEPVKPQVLHPRLSRPSLIRCQTPLNSLIYGDEFGNYVRVTDFLGMDPAVASIAGSPPFRQIFPSHLGQIVSRESGKLQQRLQFIGNPGGVIRRHGPILSRAVTVLVEES